MWYSQAGLTAEIGSWLLFDRYIIPAALDLFTKQRTEPQKAISGRRGWKPRGLCNGQAASVCRGGAENAIKKGGWDFLRRLTQSLNGPELSVSIFEVPTDVSSASWVHMWRAKRFGENRVA